MNICRLAGVAVLAIAGAAGQRAYDNSRPPAAMSGEAAANYNMGLQMQARGDHVHAVWRFGMAIRQSAPSADLLFARGVSYMALRNYAEAQADFEGAIRLRPNFASAQAKLQETRQALGMGNSSPGAGQSMYDNFRDILNRSRISLADHPSYTERYVTARAHLFCSLMTDGNLTKLTQEIVFPPVQNMTETVRDRSRVETAILMSGTPAYCPNNQPMANDWIRTNMR